MPAAVKKSKPAPRPDPGALIQGYGTLKGKLALPDDIEWTEPIYEQVLSRAKRRTDHVPGKRRAAKKAQPGVAA